MIQFVRESAVSVFNFAVFSYCKPCLQSELRLSEVQKQSEYFQDANMKSLKI